MFWAISQEKIPCGVVGGCWKRENKRKKQPYLKTRFHKTRFHQQLPGVKLMVRNKSVKKTDAKCIPRERVCKWKHTIQVAFHKNKYLQTCSTWTLFPSTQKTPPVVTGASILFIIHPPQKYIVHINIMYIQN